MSILGNQAHILLQEYNLRAYLNNVEGEQEVETHENTVFGNDSKTYQIGLDDGTVTFEGYADPAANAIDDILHTNKRTED